MYIILSKDTPSIGVLMMLVECAEQNLTQVFNWV